jgi:hypothetical protein
MDAVCGIWRAFRWTGLCLMWVEMGACLLLCLAHLLGLLGPSVMFPAILQGAARSGPAHRSGCSVVCGGDRASFDSAC